MIWPIRKVVVTVEDVHHDGGPRLSEPLRVGVASAVVGNPFAGRYEENLVEPMEALNELGRELARRLVKALQIEPKQIESYGKGSIVGASGELEHGALWHAPGGWGMRQILGDTKAIVPGNKMIGAVGSRLMIPLGHVNAAYVRSHFSSAGVSIDDAPRPNEIVFALAMSTGGRPHARLGGLLVSQIEGKDGLR